MTKLLQDCKIMITRPQQQALNLCEKIRELGGIPIIAPALVIHPYPITATLLQVLRNLPQQAIAIFISANAVEKTMQLLQDYQIAWPTSIQIAVIGPGTEQAIRQAGWAVNFCPTQNFSSEGLLALAAFQAPLQQNIVLFRGLGGREFLAEQLRIRGANVQEAIVYQRIAPVWTFEELFPDWQTQSPDIIICSSNSGLQNLWDKAGNQYQAQLLSIPFILVSERMRQFAQVLGLQSIILAANATDHAILDTLMQWRRTTRGF